MKFKFEQLANDQMEERQLSAYIINLINQSAVLMCGGNFELAKVKIDAVLESLELKI